MYFLYMLRFVIFHLYLYFTLLYFKDFSFLFLFFSHPLLSITFSFFHILPFTCPLFLTWFLPSSPDLFQNIYKYTRVGFKLIFCRIWMKVKFWSVLRLVKVKKMATINSVQWPLFWIRWLFWVMHYLYTSQKKVFTMGLIGYQKT